MEHLGLSEERCSPQHYSWSPSASLPGLPHSENRADCYPARCDMQWTLLKPGNTGTCPSYPCCSLLTALQYQNSWSLAWLKRQRKENLSNETWMRTRAQKFQLLCGLLYCFCVEWETATHFARFSAYPVRYKELKPFAESGGESYCRSRLCNLMPDKQFLCNAIVHYND